MNDLLLEYILKNIEIDNQKEEKIKLNFLDEFGAGITKDDELTKKLICLDEEGIEYKN